MPCAKRATCCCWRVDGMTRPFQRRELFALGALTAIAMLTWLWSRQGIEEDEPAAQVGTAAPGYYLYGASILGTDEEGRALFRVQAASAEELPAENRLLLSDVAVRYQPETDVPWVLTATEGHAFLEETYLDFSGAVELTRTEQSDAGGPMVIRTSSLRLEPETFDVYTDGPVSLWFGDRRLDAVGLDANLKAERLALESNIHGEFGP